METFHEFEWNLVLEVAQLTTAARWCYLWYVTQCTLYKEACGAREALLPRGPGESRASGCERSGGRELTRENGRRAHRLRSAHTRGHRSY
jgi:hypothetical protein